MNRAATWIALAVSSSLTLGACCFGGKDAKTTTSGEAAPVEATASEWPPMPTPGPAPSFSVPEATRFELDNGIPVTLVTMGSVPLVELQLNIYTGSAADPVGKEGLAAVTADMLNEGAGEWDGLAIERELQTLASDVSLGAGMDASVVRINSLEDNLEPTLAIVKAMLAEPTFSNDDLERVVEDRTRALVAAKDDLGTVAFRSFYRVLWGTDYLGRPGVGTADSLGTIVRKDVTSFHKNVWTPANAGLVVVSRLDQAEIEPLLEETLGTWTGDPKAKVPAVAVEAPPRQEGVSVYWVDKPGQSQSYIIVGNQGEPYDAIRDELLDLGNHPLGGNFTARINMNLREDKGYTYGARSWFDPDRHGGTFAASASVKADTTAASITEFLSEIRGALGDRPITAEEHARSVGSLVQEEPGSYERMSSTLGRYARADQLGAPADSLTGRSKRLQAITLDMAQSAFAEVVSGDDLVILVVGDRAVAGPAVEELGLGPIIALDDEGNRVE